MVLEHLFPSNWIEKKFSYALLLGMGYSLVGILLARLLFGANSGLASVIFVSLLLIPSFRKLFAREEKKEEHEKKFSLKRLYTDNKKIILAYLGIFIGAYIMYYLVAFLSTYLHLGVISVFREQLFLDPVIAGRATSQLGVFWGILANNWWVLLACFFLSLISGDGAIFFIVWNASAWGVIFAYRAVAAALVMGKSPLIVAFIMQIITLPHILLEGSAYILAGVAGVIISDEIISESKELKKFLLYFASVIVVFYFLNLLLALLIYPALLIILRILVVLCLVYLLKYSFVNKLHNEVFTFNFWLFVLAIAFFIVGAIVETQVLTHSGLLVRYYTAAASFVA